MYRFNSTIIALLWGVGVYAMHLWQAPDATSSNLTLWDTEDLKITSVYSAAGKSDPRIICGKPFTNYFQVRVTDAPTATDLDGSYSENGTSLTVEAKRDLMLTVYYRMERKSQAETGEYIFEPGSSKDIQCFDQTAKANLTVDEFDWDASYSNTNRYNYCACKYRLAGGQKYTIYARGTTVQFFGASYTLDGETEDFDEEDTSIEETLEEKPVSDEIPAFPGAEGFARYTTTGGRGGKVVHVTNLNDSGAGSLREAVSGSEKKIVVFDISGIINLEKELKIGANTTIFGQTAPGEGITISGATTRYSGNNIIVRFIRFRRGNVPDGVDSKEGVDATWERQKSNIIFDHCSMSWANDEIASFYDNNNFTMQWCTIGEAFNNISHAFAGIWGGKGATFHHNLIIHCNSRLPRFNGARYKWDGYDKNTYETTVLAERVDYRNNVVYNWGTGKCYGGGGFINMVNNYYKAGPATTKNKTLLTQCSMEHDLYSKYYINGNYVSAAGSKAQDYDWNGIKTDGGNGKNQTFTDPDNMYRMGADYVHSIVLDNPIHIMPTTTHSATEAFSKVIEFAGASLNRDIVDLRYAQEARDGEAIEADGLLGPGILNYIWQQPEYYILTQGESHPSGWDTDNDGIPDEWEINNGLDPHNADDASAYSVDTQGYYTNIEVYANSIVEHIIKAQNADAIESVNEYFPPCSTSAMATIENDAYTSHTGIYNLSGRKVPAYYKGILIKDGHKIYIK